MAKFKVLKPIEHGVAVKNARGKVIGEQDHKIYLPRFIANEKGLMVEANWPETLKSCGNGRVTDVDASGLIELDEKVAEPLLALGCLERYVALDAPAKPKAAKVAKPAPQKKKAK